MKDLTLQEQTEVNGGSVGFPGLGELVSQLIEQQEAINALSNLTGTSDDYHK